MNLKEKYRVTTLLSMLLLALLITPALAAVDNDISALGPDPHNMMKSAFDFYVECHGKINPTSEPCFYYLTGLIDSAVQFDCPGTNARQYQEIRTHRDRHELYG
jgi:hypothetical protein